MFEELKPHIKELRSRLTICVAVIFIAFFACFYAWEIILQFMISPLEDVLPEGSELIFVKVQEPFFTAVKVSFFSSFIISLPIIFWQFWAFVAPGLYDNEKALVIPFVLFATVMFFLGASFSYYVVTPIGFEFLIGFGSALFKAMPSIGEYVGFFTKLIVGFGIAAELPVVTFFLAKIGLVTDGMLRQFFRYAIIIIFVFSALLTPPDLITQFLMAVPMVGLYIISIYIAKVINPSAPEDENDEDESDEDEESDATKEDKEASTDTPSK